MTSPLLTEPGAVAADGPDAGVAAHYGDPYAEQRALAIRSGVVDRSHRGVLRISGPDRLSWLHSLTTQHLDHLAPGTSADALVLSPQGHVEHQLSLTDDGTAIWAHVEPGTIRPLLDFLTSMRFMLRVEPEDVTAEYAVLSVLGPDAPAELPPAGIRIDTGFGTDLIVPRAELEAQVAGLRSAGAGLGGMWAYEALRCR
jgi:folate-binding Fe-S cluster repair protein YgfZ